MALSNPYLAELAAEFGIATEFWDWKGRLTEISDDTVIAVLAAFFAWGAASQAFGAVQDVRADRSAGIASIATVLGGLGVGAHRVDQRRHRHLDGQRTAARRVPQCGRPAP